MESATLKTVKLVRAGEGGCEAYIPVCGRLCLRVDDYDLFRRSWWVLLFLFLPKFEITHFRKSRDPPRLVGGTPSSSKRQRATTFRLATRSNNDDEVQQMQRTHTKIVLNLSCPKQQVTWLSKWDGVLAGTKYMMLAASSSFKGKSDMAKYDKAMKLKGFIEKIRADYTKKLSSSDKRTKQVSPKGAVGAYMDFSCVLRGLQPSCVEGVSHYAGIPSDRSVVGVAVETQ